MNFRPGTGSLHPVAIERQCTDSIGVGCTFLMPNQVQIVVFDSSNSQVDIKLYLIVY